MKRFLYILFFLLSSTFYAIGQDRPLRAEIEVPDGFSSVEVRSLENHYVLAYSTLSENVKGMHVRLFFLFDQNLKMVWAERFPVHADYTLTSHVLKEDTLTLIFRGDGKLSSVMQLKILWKNALFAQKVIHTSSDKTNKTAELHNGKIFVLQQDRDEMNVCVIHPKDSIISTSSTFSVRDHDVYSTYFDTVFSQFYVVTSTFQRRKDECVLRAFDMDANIVREDVLTPPENYRLLHARVVRPDSLTLLVMGIYNNKNEEQKFENYDNGTESAGFFLCVKKAGMPDVFSFLPYEKMQGLDNLSPDHKQILAQKKKRARDQAFSLGLYLQPRIIYADNQYYLGGETYDRRIRVTTEMYYDYYGRMVPYTKTEFEGFDYRELFVVALDSTNMYFANSYVMDLSKSFFTKQLKPRSIFYPMDSGMMTMYCNNNLIFYSFTENGETQSDNLKIEQMQPADKISSSWDCEIIHWYDHHFLTYGFQMLQNNQSTKSKRTVFYLTKISYD